MNSKERDFLIEVIRARANDREDLLQAVIANVISVRERAELCEMLGGEFAERGVGDNSEPNAYGLRLERLIDTINRSNLHPLK